MTDGKGGGAFPGRGKYREGVDRRDFYRALAATPVILIQKLRAYITVNMLHLHYQDQTFCLGK